MNILQSRSTLLAAAGCAALLISGCSTTSNLGPAPVVDRTSTLQPGASIEDPSGRTLPGRVTDSGRLHTVAPGDTLYNISVRYGFLPAQLSALNGISDPTQLRIGQVLHLPVSTTAPREYVPNPNIRVTEATQAGAPVEPATVRMGTQPVPLEDGESVNSARQPAEAVPSAGAAATPAEEKAEPAPAPVQQVVPGSRMIWPVQGKILATFGGSSKGVDIAGVEGDVVVSAMAGEVFYVGDAIAEYGNLVIVKHSPTLVTAYAHNSSVTVKVGQRVKSGEKIAELGKTGTTRPMLHFEVREKGTPVDPMKFLPRH